MVGTMLILATAIVLSVYSLSFIYREGISADIIPYNAESLLASLGFSIYSFEGIAVVMPIMQSCAEPREF